MWDELFMFPYFLTKFPEVCHGHLMYRYRKLSRAKENAQACGCVCAPVWCVCVFDCSRAFVRM